MRAGACLEPQGLHQWSYEEPPLFQHILSPPLIVTEPLPQPPIILSELTATSEPVNGCFSANLHICLTFPPTKKILILIS